MASDPYLRMWLLMKTERAVQVCDRAKAGSGYRTWWIPRSMIGYSRREAPAPDALPVFVFTLPEWLIEREQLWSFTTD